MWDLASMSIVLSLIYNFCFVWRDKNNIIFLNYRIAAIYEQTKKKTSFIISLRNQHLACFFLTFPFKFFNFFFTLRLFPSGVYEIFVSFKYIFDQLLSVYFWGVQLRRRTNVRKQRNDMDAPLQRCTLTCSVILILKTWCRVRFS